jgi:hypothetical protein
MLLSYINHIFEVFIINHFYHEDHEERHEAHKEIKKDLHFLAFVFLGVSIRGSFAHDLPRILLLFLNTKLTPGGI